MQVHVCPHLQQITINMVESCCTVSYLTQVKSRDQLNTLSYVYLTHLCIIVHTVCMSTKITSVTGITIKMYGMKKVLIQK